MENSAIPLQCPWCSAPVPTGSEFCVRCGAALVERGQPQPQAQNAADLAIPGVTSIDPRLAAYAQRQHEPRKKRGRLAGLLEPEPDSVSDPIREGPLSAEERQAISPPSLAVREEMLRMEREALERALLAELAAREADERAAKAKIASAVSPDGANVAPESETGTDGAPPASE